MPAAPMTNIGARAGNGTNATSCREPTRRRRYAAGPRRAVTPRPCAQPPGGRSPAREPARPVAFNEYASRAAHLCLPSPEQRDEST